MANFNKVLIMGNLTRDPEVRATQKGTPICQFGLAVNRTFKTESGELREEATFVDIEAWGRQAETIEKYLKKGSPLFVEGRLKLDTWEDKQTGEKRSRLKIVLENFQFLGRGEGAGQGGGEREERDEGERRPAPAARPAPPQRPAPPRPAPRQDLDEDIPF